MPRRKAFSAKQKKIQLQERRKRKEGGPLYARDQSFEVGTEPDADGIENSTNRGDTEPTKCPLVTSIDLNVDRVNQQPLSQPPVKYDPNRYRLHFFKEKDDVIRKRKEKARQPYQTLSETAFELDVDFDPANIIDIPKRPSWDYSLTKQRLEANEERYFKEYLDAIFNKHERESLSYFELNLETWRQLWRVLEMSDMFLLITDIRHPALHFPPALYTYITEILRKDIILILNKVDLAPPSLVVAWQHFFKSRSPLLKVVCFTSFPKTRGELEKVSTGLGKVIFKRRKRGTYRALGPEELLAVCLELVQDKVDLSSWSKKIDVDQGISYQNQSDDDDDDDDGNDDDDDDDDGNADDDHDGSYHNHESFKDGVLTIGCIGFPNVGKSSVLNGLMGKKVVSVSKTPGHTKHFQTIYLTSTVRLCDSPGLVFPSKSDRTLQVLAGIYPISQVREPFSVVEFLAQRLDLPKLLHIKHPEDDDHNEVGISWTAMDICDAWAVKKGFLTARASRADTFRAANNILNLAVDGRLCLCFYPPGYTQSKEKWTTHQDTQDFIELQHQYRLKLQASGDIDSDESSGSQTEDEQESSPEENKEPTSFTSKNPFDLLVQDE